MIFQMEFHAYNHFRLAPSSNYFAENSFAACNTFSSGLATLRFFCKYSFLKGAQHPPFLTVFLNYRKQPVISQVLLSNLQSKESMFNLLPP